ncbi:hypothetical protein [Salimicrobium halophilum]|uniref:Uncharacterized protein n=1 Tax=Salimicrobium halophilum TaxID=86666 RepID=A0A1G8S264_9BACI|nr:hypothetical protein [Salimicrobium halophilum]SDJ23327.1 hypothetical protein SAMN04490247_1214 [Salimicrobium halophilum]
MSKGAKQYNYDTEKVKNLIKNTNLTYRDISKQTGCPYASVVYHGRRIRGRTNGKNTKGPVNQPAPVLVKRQEEENLSFSITKEKVSVHQYDKEMEQLIHAAKQMGATTIDITVKK